jgi:hypothetical protein
MNDIFTRDRKGAGSNQKGKLIRGVPSVQISRDDDENSVEFVPKK